MIGKIFIGIITAVLGIVLYFLSIYFYEKYMDSEFKKKKLVATCSEDQGMATYEAFLYEDSTFYVSGAIFMDPEWGDYSIQNDSLLFFHSYGERHMCSSYFIDRTKGKIFPVIDSSYFEEMWYRPERKSLQ